MLEITAEELNKFSNLNDKVRKVEVRAKDYLLQLEPLLQKQKNEGLIDDFEIVPRVSVFSYDEDYCKSKKIELGDEIITEKEISYMLSGLTSDLFYLNGNEFKGSKNHPFKDLHFGYLMHCLVFHSQLDFDDFMHIDDVWLELEVRLQFFTDKTPFK